MADICCLRCGRYILLLKMWPIYIVMHATRTTPNAAYQHVLGLLRLRHPYYCTLYSVSGEALLRHPVNSISAALIRLLARGA